MLFISSSQQAPWKHTTTKLSSIDQANGKLWDESSLAPPPWTLPQESPKKSRLKYSWICAWTHLAFSSARSAPGLLVICPDQTYRVVNPDRRPESAAPLTGMVKRLLGHPSPQLGWPRILCQCSHAEQDHPRLPTTPFPVLEATGWDFLEPAVRLFPTGLAPPRCHTWGQMSSTPLH